jgi:hypothetical protein
MNMSPGISKALIEARQHEMRAAARDARLAREAQLARHAAREPASTLRSAARHGWRRLWLTGLFGRIAAVAGRGA